MPRYKKWTFIVMMKCLIKVGSGGNLTNDACNGVFNGLACQALLISGQVDVQGQYRCMSSRLHNKFPIQSMHGESYTHAQVLEFVLRSYSGKHFHRLDLNAVAIAMCTAAMNDLPQSGV